MSSATVEYVDRLRAALAGRYDIDREIGRGGMAVVYHALDRQHDREVAIKLLRPELGAMGPDRFLREIRIEARLQHPNILPLYDSGTADGLLYHVMPFVEGETLRDRIRREKQLPVPDAVRNALEVSGALLYAHAHGVDHRDIKPANILLSGGHALVADFGIARAIASAGEDPLTSSGLAVGTPEYMSPEQGTGAREVDGRSDLYALGCTLYEMLGGDPPFTGRTPQSIIARHRHDPPPSLRVVRPTVAPALQVVVETALAKVPADRYATAADMAQALEAAASTPAALTPAALTPAAWTPAALTPAALTPAATQLPERPGRSRWRPAVLAAVAGIVALGIWRAAAGPAVRADPNRVMVFPLIDRSTASGPSGAGEDVAIMIGSGLEHTEPLKWIDGWTWMSPAQRENTRLLVPADAGALSRAHGAGYYLDGSVVRLRDSATVVLRLNDALADSLVAQSSVSGDTGRTSLPQLGLQAMVNLLPALLQPGSRIDPAALEPLTRRRPAAVADWLQGEREYRGSRFIPALDYFRRAVAADSALVLAALRGAESALWLDRPGEAAVLLRTASAHAGLLPIKYARFTQGLIAYSAGRPDSAIAAFREAVAGDSTWSGAWNALGEAYFHLIPPAPPPDSAAERAFERARRADPSFAIPLYHLTQIAMRGGDRARADRLLGEFRRFAPDTTWIGPLAAMVDCVRSGGSRYDWTPAVRPPGLILKAAKYFPLEGSSGGCAEGGFRAVLASPAAGQGERWGATLGLQSLLLAEGRAHEVKPVLDSAIANGNPAAAGLYLVDAAAGYGMEADAARVAESLSGPYRRMKAPGLWYLGVWAYHEGAAARLDSLTGAITAVADTGSGTDSLLAAAVAARRDLLRADTAAALRRLRGISPLSPLDDLQWGIWESFGLERLLLARLLAARHQWEEAYQVASGFDHPQPVIYSMYLPASLVIRLEAARTLGRTKLVRALTARVAALDSAATADRES